VIGDVEEAGEIWLEGRHTADGLGYAGGTNATLPDRFSWIYKGPDIRRFSEILCIPDPSWVIDDGFVKAIYNLKHLEVWVDNYVDRVYLAFLLLRENNINIATFGTSKGDE